MADAKTTTNAPQPRRRRSWLRALAWIFGILVIVLVAAYFVATSSAFVRGVILPKAGAALHATITASDASVSPFHELVLRDLKVQTTGTEPLLTAPMVRVRYHLMDIIGGHINVDEITVTSPTVVLVTNPNGSSNLDPLLKSSSSGPSKPSPAPSGPSKPPQVAIQQIALTDATVRQVKLYAGGQRDTTEVSHLNLNVSNIQNGQTGKLGVSADVRMANNPPAPATNALLQAKFEGNFTFGLTSDLKPATVGGSAKLAVSQAEGGMAQLAGLNANLDCTVTPTEIKEVTLRFQKANTPLGQLAVSGPFDLAKTEGKLTIRVSNIDRNLLSLAGAGGGLDFGPTTLNSSNLVQLAKGGASIAAAGELNLTRFQVTRAGETTPSLDLRAAYNIEVDRAASSMLVRALLLDAEQRGNSLLRAELSKPMPIAWGQTSTGVGEAALNLTLNHLNLADWKPFVGAMAPAGDVNLKAQILSQAGGKRLSFDVNSQVNNLTANVGSNQITQATVTFQLKGTAADMKQFDLPEYRLEVSRQNQSLVTLSGSGTYNQGTQAADLKLAAQAMLAPLLAVLPQPDMKISNGSVQLQAQLTQNAQGQNVTGTFALADLTGQVGKNQLNRFSTSADLDIGRTPQEIQIRKLAGKITAAGSAGGSFEVTGTYRTNGAAQITAQLIDLNQNALRPFLEPMLGDKQLVSVAMSGNAATQYDPQGASALKGEFQVKNLVVNDPKGQFPKTPLAAGLALDVSLDKQVADIRQCQLSLTPTTRATNQLQLTGRVDMTQTNAYQGNLKLAADSLDLTSYYDLFAGQTNAASAKSPVSPSAPKAPAGAPAAAQAEPGPIQLPCRNFVADVSVGRLYLRQIEITNLQTTTRLDGGQVVIDPCKLVVNGAPLASTVNLDLSVPGYKYNLTFDAHAVPLAPLVDSLAPDRKGLVSGTFTAQANVAGSGTTGANLQKSLSGQLDLGSTNLNLVVDNLPNESRWTPLLKRLVNAITTLPDLLANPAGGGSSLVQGTLNLLGGKSAASGASPAGGATGDLKKSPIDSIQAKATMGSGQIVLQQAVVQSPAFRADATGNIQIAPVLTNSPVHIPVNVSLLRSVAQLLNLVPPNTPTNATYVPLPNYLTMEGTLGDPKSTINKTALLGTALQGLSGLGGKNAGTLQSLGNALTGGTNSNTNQTPAGGLGGLLQGLGGGLRGKSPATNAPANTNTNQSPVGNLLNNLFGPKK